MLLPAPNSNVATVLWFHLDKVGVGVCLMPHASACVARPLGVCFIVIGISVARRVYAQHG